MSMDALREGAHAFAAGLARTTNPHSADGESWMNWRDGWEQAKAMAARLADGAATGRCGSVAADRQLEEA